MNFSSSSEVVALILYSLQVMSLCHSTRQLRQQSFPHSRHSKRSASSFSWKNMQPQLAVGHQEMVSPCYSAQALSVCCWYFSISSRDRITRRSPSLASALHSSHGQRSGKDLFPMLLRKVSTRHSLWKMWPHSRVSTGLENRSTQQISQGTSSHSAGAFSWSNCSCMRRAISISYSSRFLRYASPSSGASRSSSSIVPSLLRSLGGASGASRWRGEGRPWQCDSMKPMRSTDAPFCRDLRNLTILAASAGKSRHNLSSCLTMGCEATRAVVRWLSVSTKSKSSSMGRAVAAARQPMQKAAKGYSSVGMEMEPSLMRSRRRAQCAVSSDINITKYESCLQAVLIVKSQQWAMRWNYSLLMFRRTSEEELQQRRAKDSLHHANSLNKLRILEGLPLKKINDSLSSHSSVAASSLHSSLNNLTASSHFSLRSSILSTRKDHPSPLPRAQASDREEATQGLLQRHFERPFTKSLVQFLNKDWSALEQQYLAEKKLQNFVKNVIQRGSWLQDLLNEFLEKEYSSMPSDDRRAMTGLLLRESTRAFSDLEGILPDILRKIPEERVLAQETVLEELSGKLLEIYDPKFAYSQAKMKERLALYLDDFTAKRNSLKSELCEKLRPTLHFLEQAEAYFAAYQKELLRLKTQLAAVENERTRYQELLGRKSNFEPLQLDYDRLCGLREQAQDQIKKDLDSNIVQFHENLHTRQVARIAQLEQANAALLLEKEQLAEEVGRLKEQMGEWRRNLPTKADAAAQVFLLSTSKGVETLAGASGATALFLENVVTPFSFGKEVAGSVLSVVAVDKLLGDYESVRSRVAVASVEGFVLEWFVVRTGCKKVAQLFLKNLQYSLRELRTTHKRFWLFQRLCGWAGVRGRNLQEDLEAVFFGTHLCWYYFVRLALLYRAKLADNPNGYHFLPPLPCEDIFKLPLRKIYELAEEFLSGEGVEVPGDLTQRIDHYCINEISKYKAGDEQFQRETLEEIHILREINFDLIAGFLLEYLANLRCATLEKLLRTVQNKQRQDGAPLAYSDFEAIYRRFYKERRARIEQVFAKLCQVNQHDMLDVDNLRPFVSVVLEDEAPLRSAFEKLEPLRALVLSEKAALRGEKKMANPNSYENFRERYYHEFYDFYSTTAFLEETFKIVRALIRKRLKKAAQNEQQITSLIDPKPPQPPASTRKASILSRKSEEESEDSESQSEGKSGVSSARRTEREGEESKDFFVGKVEEWNKIMARVPHFAANVLTIEQIVIHNMRRKEMVEATEFAWRTLREILSVLGKD